MTSYYASGSLSLIFYDLMTTLSEEHLRGDASFYAEAAGISPCRILELGCGTGRISLALADLGHAVTGLDLSAPMLEQARQKQEAIAPTNRAVFLEVDMASIALGQRFDLIIAPFYSFSHLETETARRSAMEAIARHLEPHGRAILHMVAGPTLSAHIPPEHLANNRGSIRLTEAGAILTVGIEARDVDHGRRLCSQRIAYSVIDEDGNIRVVSVEELRYGWMTAEELSGLLDATGLMLIERRNSFTDAPGIEDILILAPAA
jgi:SAM-dependent methyltransferase